MTHLERWQRDEAVKEASNARSHERFAETAHHQARQARQRVRQMLSIAEQEAMS